MYALESIASGARPIISVRYDIFPYIRLVVIYPQNIYASPLIIPVVYNPEVFTYIHPIITMIKDIHNNFSYNIIIRVIL